ncbi:hypothetical protein HELRODRAFT_185807 [Helobdella robusta]|uniref:DZF domain-containing protein n=1 Tax=Helobdella robusta TaxID=6412 RepID=T1FNB4_HELRO|nr:hypothetical protein HELRODRAFT_185807 [Helobdella robusta]ESN99828.1 hypothetical protein HELRODRAFT_185807 [Helobdella robusta]
MMRGRMHQGNAMNMNRTPSRRGGFKPNQKTFVPHVTFDIIQCENLFQRVKPPTDDKMFTEALLKKVQELTPNAKTQASVLSLVTSVQTVLDNLVIASGTFDAAVVDEVRQVGNHKKGTLLSGDNVAEIVVVLKTLPTFEAVQSLSNKVYQDMMVSSPREAFGATLNECGFEITNHEAVSRVYVTTIPPNFKFLDASLHLDSKMMEGHLLSIRRTRWFEENACHSTVKVLVRLLSDLRNRFQGFQPLTPWIIDVFSHYCVMVNPQRTPLSINIAIRRCLQLLSSGFFLPGSQGIFDPCADKPNVRVHTVMSMEQQDQVCFTAQTLLRVLSHGGFMYLLGFKKNLDIVNDVTLWNGVVVTPSEKAYEKEDETNMANSAAAGTADTTAASATAQPIFGDDMVAVNSAATAMTSS